MAGVLSIACAMILAILYFRFNPFREWGLEEEMADLAAKGQLLSIEYQAKRAFEVEESFVPGSQYFIELEDDSVLFVGGEYLYEYDPIDDDPELNCPRRFPCTKFVIHRHARKRYVLDIQCEGRVLEPELVAPAFTEQEYRQNAIPKDGQIIRDRTYDAIKEQRMLRR